MEIIYPTISCPGDREALQTIDRLIDRTQYHIPAKQTSAELISIKKTLATIINLIPIIKSRRSPSGQGCAVSLLYLNCI